MADAADLLDNRHGRVNGDDKSLKREPRDPFRNYTQEQARAYALGRGTVYPPLLYSSIYSYHTEGGGDYKCLLDVGSGPGNATRDLASSFCEVYAIDASPEMITEARTNDFEKRTKTGKEIIFAVVSAERLDEIEGVAEASVDMITVAMSAHWFDMSKFWTKAAKVLKPGGTVAIWTCSSLYAHPDTPNYEKVQGALNQLEKEKLAPYETSYNRLSSEHYDNLQLPWTVSPPVTAFPQSLFKRKEWDRDGKLSGKKDFFGNKGEVTSLEDLERSLNTVSMVTRWRQAHPEDVGTERDIVQQTMAELRDALGPKGSFVTGTATTLLLFRKETTT